MRVIKAVNYLLIASKLLNLTFESIKLWKNSLISFGYFECFALLVRC